MNSAIVNRQSQIAFTLVELLVVITIIVILLALLTPAIDRAMEMTIRTICATNERVIAQATYQYGFENRKELFTVRGREVLIAFDPQGSDSRTFHSYSEADRQVDWPAALASVGLATDRQPIPGNQYSSPPPGTYINNLPGKMWDCPGRRDWKSYWNVNPVYMGVGAGEPAVMWVSYAFYGGVAIWKHEILRDQRGLSPRKISDPGDRVLVSDATTKTHGVWGGPEAFAVQTGGSPSHLDEGPHPAGHNQGYLDGSAGWVPADRLMALHSWNDSLSEVYFFWQQDIGSWSRDEPTLKFSHFK